MPVLVLDSGEIITENIAILLWIASQAPEFLPVGPLGHTRLLEALAFISAEIHKGIKPFLARNASEADKLNATDAISKRRELIAKNLNGPDLLGRFTCSSH